MGFNEFLPQGYKIEVTTNDTITVHQPKEWLYWGYLLKAKYLDLFGIYGDFQLSSRIGWLFIVSHVHV